jgi:hypothetical protein
VLDADADADEAVGDAELLAVLSRDGGVGHDRGVLDEALDAAEALGEGEHADGREEATRGLEVAAQVERDHAAEAGHLPAGEGVLRVAGEAGVEDALDLGVLREEAGDAGGVLWCRSHAQREGLEAAQGQVAVLRPGTAPTAFCRKARRSWRPGSRPTMTPPTTSEWPPMYLVVL